VSGAFITLEGIDGSGKTTQAGLLADWLRTAGHSVCLTREPGGTHIGETVRDLLLSPDRSMPPTTELFLYLADRSLHVTEVIRPALENGQVVVCERHADSTLAYQGYGRGLDCELLRRLNALATDGISPDLTIVLDIPPDRARLDENSLDRLESEGGEFLARVAEGFRKLAREEPERVKLIDASPDAHVVNAQVTSLVRRLLQT
jgi:dTMP kinase